MHFTKATKPKKSSVYGEYWKFAAKRQEVFNKRLQNPIGPWTNDPVIKGNRFTNVFRASDRVSQYLINLQYTCSQQPKELFFTTILFKIFNKIETFTHLVKELDSVSAYTFDFKVYNEILTNRMALGYTNYSAAYIMPSAGSTFGHKFKHSNHLALIEKMLNDQVFDKIQESNSLEEVYKILLSYPSFGSFLAFQYTIDLNYSSLTNFSEMDFVVAGPGAKNGILKCFESIGDYSFEDVIRLVADEQELVSECFGIEVPKLWGRTLQLIDCQNIFCEVDKYLRVTHPQISISGRTRIKQKYSIVKDKIDYFFPPKWGLNEKIVESGISLLFQKQNYQQATFY